MDFITTEAITHEKSILRELDQKIASLEEKKKEHVKILSTLEQLLDAENMVKETRNHMSTLLGKKRKVSPATDPRTRRPKQRWDVVGFLVKPSGGQDEVLYSCLREKIRSTNNMICIEKVSIRSIDKLISDRSALQWRCNRTMLLSMLHNNLVTKLGDNQHDYIRVRRMEENGKIIHMLYLD